MSVWQTANHFNFNFRWLNGQALWKQNDTKYVWKIVLRISLHNPFWAIARFSKLSQLIKEKVQISAIYCIAYFRIFICYSRTLTALHKSTKRQAWIKREREKKITKINWRKENTTTKWCDERKFHWKQFDLYTQSTSKQMNKNSPLCTTLSCMLLCGMVSQFMETKIYTLKSINRQIK